MADLWQRDFDGAKDLANETLALIQDRNLKFPDGGSEASRLTATARRKLGTLGSQLDNLRAALESPQYASLTENERNRRRDLLTALRGRREQMLTSLKRERPRGAEVSAPLSAGQAARETDVTAERDNAGLLALQQQIMHQQDDDLALLERSVGSTKHVALQINEEAGLQNRLLDDLHADVDATGGRLRAAQRRLQLVMRRGGSCKMQLLMCLLLAILVVVIVIGFKIAFH